MKIGLEKLDSDLQKLVTSEDFATFNKREPATNAVKLLGTLSGGPPTKIFEQHKYTYVRYFLMAQIIFGNANHSKGDFKHDCSASETGRNYGSALCCSGE
jgi:hypothetical protein